MKKQAFNYEALTNAFRSAGDADLSMGMEKYMRDMFSFMGIKAPERRKILSDYLKLHKLPEKEDWQSVILKLWSEDEREFQYIGMEIAFKCKKYYEVGDHAFFRQLVTQKSWWDTVDYIAATIIGYYFRITAPQLLEQVTGEWNWSDDKWLVRTSIIFQLKYKEEVNFDLLQNYIHRHALSNEFFIQKAMGWALRQYSKFRPKEVIRFVEQNELPSLTQREALKHVNRT